MTDKKVVDAVSVAIDHCLTQELGRVMSHDACDYLAKAAIQAYQDNATIDDIKLMAKRLGVVVVPVDEVKQLHDIEKKAGALYAHMFKVFALSKGGMPETMPHTFMELEKALAVEPTSTKAAEG